MPFKATATIPPDGVARHSDIETVQYVDGALVVVIACALNENRSVDGIRLRFPSTAGFRFLDELDLTRYWTQKDFPRGSYLLEVFDGGWASEENGLQGHERPRREWLIVTGNACVNVFCDSEPEVTRLSWPRRFE